MFDSSYNSILVAGLIDSAMPFLLVSMGVLLSIAVGFASRLVTQERFRRMQIAVTELSLRRTQPALKVDCDFECVVNQVPEKSIEKVAPIQVTIEPKPARRQYRYDEMEGGMLMRMLLAEQVRFMAIKETASTAK